MKEYKKYYTITAPPEDVYTALTNPATIQLWSGEAAEMSTEPGTEFSLWEESIVGKNLEFIPGKKNCTTMVFRRPGSSFYRNDHPACP
jgi:uncharacterized protein YndB with AHSA1/START domain